MKLALTCSPPPPPLLLQNNHSPATSAASTVAALDLFGSPASQVEQCSTAEGIANSKSTKSSPSIALALARLARGGGGASSCPTASSAAEAAVNSLLASFPKQSEKTMEDLSSLLLAAKEVSAAGGKVDASALQAAADVLPLFKAKGMTTKSSRKLFSARPGMEDASSVASVQAVVAAAAASEAGASVSSSLTSGVVRALLSESPSSSNGEGGAGGGLPFLDADVDGGSGALLAAARALSLVPTSSLARIVFGAAKSAALATPEGAEAAALALRALEKLSPSPLVLQRKRKSSSATAGENSDGVAASLLLTDLRGDASAAAASGASVSASLSRTSDGKRVASSIPLTPRGGGVWTLDAGKALAKTEGEAGVFDAVFSISSEGASGGGASSSSSSSLASRVALPGAGIELKGGSARVSVVGGVSRAAAAAKPKTASFPDKATESFSLLSSPNAKLKIEIELVDSVTGSPVEQPGQVAALIKGSSKGNGDEAYLPASPAAVPSGSSTPPPGAFVVTLTAGSVAAQQVSGTTAGGTYEVELVVAGSSGGSKSSSCLRWKQLARVELPAVDHRGRSTASLAAAAAAIKKEPNFISSQAADAGSAEDAAVSYPLPEIVHAQRAPAVPASDAAAAVATLAVVLPLLALPLALKAAGLNFRGAPAAGSTDSLLALAFHACVAVMLFSYVVFWAKQTVLEFLPKLLAVGAATVATGHGALRARAAARRSGGGGLSSLAKKLA